MKKFIYSWYWIFLLFCFSTSIAQEPDTIQKSSQWSHNLEAYSYFMKDDFIFLPMYSVNKNWLHLEARYNYEDMKTFSAWFGYNFSGGKKFQYTITPMLGGITGNTKGIAPGLELDFEFKKFELYSEAEYVFDLQNRENNYYYNWTDLTYAPADWIWFGISAQRTRLYQTNLEIQRGLMAGGGHKWFGITGYLYNAGFDDPYFILALSITLP